ncbi:MAG TPA: RNA polymerase sigma-70 factor [Dysgonamonadaceae bacterium]|jgi:RNA polymerase sigma-70 factor (family 1)|nr:RNA polymerase sigma-70 factor [Dysgonamonadaceae bacterium]
MLPPKDEIHDLMALRNGSSQAFEKIYYRYSGKLYNFIMTLSHGDKYLAEEIVQDAFVKLWEVRDQIHPEKSVLFYLSTIAKNMLMNKYQRQTIEFLYQKLLLETQIDHDNSIEEELDRKWLEKFFNELIEQLPPSRKKIFVLSKKEGFSNKQIAEILNISVSTVETQLSLAMKFIRKEFQKNRDKLLLISICLLI